MFKIFKCRDFNFVEKYIRQADQNTLIVFDVDDVLITSIDEILKTYNNSFSRQLEDELESRLSDEKCLKLWSLILLQRKNIPVDPLIISSVKKLALKENKILALTNTWTGTFGHIKSIEDWRIKELNEFGYSFGDCWPKGKIDIELKPKDAGRLPLFKQGVLFTCGIPKGKVLKYFLKKISWMPRKIIFIDDMLENIHSVGSFSRKAGIDFLGFHYTVVKDQNISPLNRTRAEMQFKILETEQVWLSDIEIDKRYSSRNK